MKYCNKCGLPLKNDERFCAGCGTECNTKESGSLHVLDNDSDSADSTIKKVENRIANYYNDTYLGAGSSDKYVVLHRDTTVSGNICNVVVRYQGNVFAEVSVNTVTGDCTVRSKPVKKTVERTGANVFICIVAVLVMINIVCLPFICNRFWSITEDINRNAFTFSEMLDALSDGDYSSDDVPMEGLYYLGGLACAVFTLIGALGKSPGMCRVGSLLGIALTVYIFYLVYLGDTKWYVGVNDAQLTFAYYLTCVGFISTLIASLYKEE